MATTTLYQVQRAKGLLSRFIKRETVEGRTTPLGFPQAYQASSTSPNAVPNPFIPLKNPATGKWRPARYSRRRQADLVKSARLLGVEEHLPLGPKGQRSLGGIPTEPLPSQALKTRLAKNPVHWVGEPAPLNEKGLYGSRRFLFKGHKWERERPQREQNMHDFKVKFDQKRWAIVL